MLRNFMQRIRSGNPSNAVVAGDGPRPLNWMASPDNPDTLTVIPINNGFLVAARKYNPAGADKVDATFAPDAQALSDTLVSLLAQQKLNAR
jgi:hypothetical protein